VHFPFFICHSKGGSLLARIDRGVTMDPVTSPLIHKDSGHQARFDPGEETPSATVWLRACNVADENAPFRNHLISPLQAR
jgi:hypothetical protein